MRRGISESKVHHLFPGPKIKSWKRFAGDSFCTAQVIVYPGAEKRGSIIFHIKVPDGPGGNVKGRMEIEGFGSNGNFSEKEVGAARRTAKDTAAEFYKTYKVPPERRR